MGPASLLSRLEDYAAKYQTVRMERRHGILQMTLHTDGGALRWGFLPHGELPEAFHDVGADRENRVVIITGTGDEFSGPRATPGTSSFPSRPSNDRIDRIPWEGRHLLMRLLEIEVPVISAINGPAWRHSEIPLLCDIVLAAVLGAGSVGQTGNGIMVAGLDSGVAAHPHLKGLGQAAGLDGRHGAPRDNPREEAGRQQPRRRQ